MASHRPCSFYGCENYSTKARPYQMFEIPSRCVTPGSAQEARCSEWIQRTCNPELIELGIVGLAKRKRCVCADHFDPHQFHDERRNKLIRDQIPKWNAIHGTQEDRCHAAVEPARSPPVCDLPADDERDVEQTPAPIYPAVVISGAASHTRVSDKTLLRMSNVSEADLTPKKRRMLVTTREYHTTARRLFRKVKKIRGTMVELKKTLTDGETNEDLAPGLSILVDTDRQNRRRKKKGRRYKDSARAFCLALYKRGPRVYRWLEQHMILPAPRTIKKWLSNIPINVGVDPVLAEHLKTTIAPWPSMHKKCVVVFDEVSLTRGLYYSKRKQCVEGFVDYGELGRQSTVADHALVFLIQGLCRSWKFPFAYYFVQGTCPTAKLRGLIEKVITALQDIGFDVEASVNDQGSTNCAAITELRTSTSDFPRGDNVYVINGKVIQHIFDIGHVIKGIRNNLITSNLITKDGVAKWDHIVETVKKDESMFKMLRKVTDKHINPKYREKMKVAPAIQVLSATMAATMGTIRVASNNVLLPGTEATQKLCEVVNKAVDLTNGPSKPADVIRGLRENVTAKSFHHQEWPKMKRTISEWVFVRKFGRTRGVRHCPASMKSWVSNLTGLQRLWKRCEESGIKTLNLRNLSQDRLENFFGCCRQACGCNTSPTTVQFEAAVKTAIVNNLTGRSVGQNCEEDDGVILSNMRSFLRLADACGTSAAHSADDNLRDGGRRDDPVYNPGRMSRVERQAPSYVMGAIIRGVLRRWPTCAACLVDLTTKDFSSDHLFIRAREYRADKEALTYPSPRAVNFFLMAQRNFTKVWTLYGHTRDIRHRVTQSFALADDLDWLQCPAHREKVVRGIMGSCADLFLRTQVKRCNERYFLQRRRNKQFVAADPAPQDEEPGVDTEEA